jgi:Fe-S-cluster-containing dehydrogenase component
MTLFDNAEERSRWVHSLPMVTPSGGPSAPSRRDFLRLAGFTLAGATVSGCERAPVHRAAPYLIAPDELVTGRSYHYASTCGGCSAACGLLVKNRDGRPIKLEGNPEHPLSRGGLCAAGQASILGLYDEQRLKQPLQGGQPAEWSAVDGAIGTKLDDIRKQKGTVRFLSGPIVSPTAAAAIRGFFQTFAGARHVVLDPPFSAAILEAHNRTHGSKVLPHYHFDKAEVIVGFDADFLGTWVSPVEFTAAYQAGRRLDGSEKSFSYHVQFESLMSLTGGKADRRMVIAPEELGTVLSALATRLAEKAKVSFPHDSESPSSIPVAFLDHLADHLWHHKSRSLIVCGSQRVDVQVICNFINHILEAYDNTLDIRHPSYQRQGSDLAVSELFSEIRDGKVTGLFIHGCNPVHDLPGSDRLADDLKRVPLIVSFAPRFDETARAAHFVCPDHHYLEGWSDAEPVSGIVSLVQPTISPLANTRSILESLAAWSGKPRISYDLVREHWEKEILPRHGRNADFQEFWDETLHNGFASVRPRSTIPGAFKQEAVKAVPSGKTLDAGSYSLVLYPKVGMPDAGHAYNPWLQELPDPICKVTWDNYASLSPAAAAQLSVGNGDVVRIEVADATLELPVFVQPGQHDQTVAVALGYGSVLSARFANIGPAWIQARPSVGADGLVGKNASPLSRWVDNGLMLTRSDARIAKTGKQQPLASTQDYNRISVPKQLAIPGEESRPIIREMTLEEYAHERAQKTKVGTPEEDLWPSDHPESNIRWGMAIDLNACTGCSACVIACQAENNIPVVGKDEVRRNREMHWMRIDRYYSQTDDHVDVAHQPMLCQHCGHAPCEVVCPVLATVHSDEGLNEQIYNRCVGTRYCANNCPYKVRRFNWFEYAHDDILQNLALNPDVTVRSRGVMEKCTFCVQRIEQARSEAGGPTRPLSDGAVQTACQQSCPAQVIAFGNLKDPNSRVAKLARSGRSYAVLGELNIRPSVKYLALVRNRPSGEGARHE